MNPTIIQTSTRSLARPLALAAIVAVLASALVACQAKPAAPAHTAAPPTALDGRGDRDDLFGVVFAAAVQHEMAITDIAYPAPDRRVYLLKTIRDEPVTLTFVGPGAGAVDPFRSPASERTGPLEVTATIGRFGAPEREARFVRDITTRLEQIEGDRAAPLRW